MNNTDENNKKNLNNLAADNADNKVDSLETDLELDINSEFANKELLKAKKREPIVSQAVLDLADYDDNEISEIAKQAAKKEIKREIKKGAMETNSEKVLCKASKYRWLFLFILSFAGLLAWVIDAQLGYDAVLANPYKLFSFIVLFLAVLIIAFSFRFIAMQTGAALMALLWSSTFLIVAIYGSVNSFLQLIPFSLYWGLILSLVLLWLWLETFLIIRKYTVVGTLIGLFLAYATLAPTWAIFKRYVAGEGIFPFEKSLLINSPEFITNILPWYIWPSSILLIMIFVWGIFLCLKNQINNFRFSVKRHYGNLFLALAFLFIIIANGLSFSHFSEALENTSGKIKNIYPKAAQWQNDNMEKILAIDNIGIVKQLPIEPIGEENIGLVNVLESEIEKTDIEPEKTDVLTNLPQSNEEIKTSLTEETLITEEEYKGITDQELEKLSKNAVDGLERQKTIGTKITAPFTSAAEQAYLFEDPKISNAEEITPAIIAEEFMEITAEPSLNELKKMADQIEKTEERLRALNFMANEQGQELEKVFETLGDKKPVNLSVPYPKKPLGLEQLDYNNLHLKLLQNRLTAIEDISINLQYMLEEQKNLLKLLKENLLEKAENIEKLEREIIDNKEEFNFKENKDFPDDDLIY